MGKSKLVFYLKEEIQKRYLMELRIHTVEDKRYAHGVKYSLLMIEPVTKQKVLMDNHHPKGPHFHLNDEEFNYNYVDEDQPVEDFKKLVLEHFGVKL